MSNMIMVETTGQFALYDMSVKPTQEIERDRPCVVFKTHQIQTQVSWGQLTILVDDLPEKANDADFKRYFEESTSRQQAIESYKASFEEPKQTTAKHKPGPKPKPQEDVTDE